MIFFATANIENKNSTKSLNFNLKYVNNGIDTPTNHCSETMQWLILTTEIQKAGVTYNYTDSNNNPIGSGINTNKGDFTQVDGTIISPIINNSGVIHLLGAVGSIVPNEQTFIPGYVYKSTNSNSDVFLDSEDVNVNYLYEATQQSATVDYIDKTTNKTINTRTYTGLTGNSIPITNYDYLANGYVIDSTKLDNDIQMTDNKLTGKYTSTATSEHGTNESNQHAVVYLKPLTASMISGESLDFGTHIISDNIKNVNAKGTNMITANIPANNDNYHIEAALSNMSDSSNTHILNGAIVHIRCDKWINSLNNQIAGGVVDLLSNQSSQRLSPEFTSGGQWSSPINDGNLTASNSNYIGNYSGAITYSLVNTPEN